MATEDLAPLNRTTGLGSGVGVTDFHQSLNEFASEANTLGQIGSKIAQTAANSFSEKMGYESGENPTGNLFPAMTESGKHYEAAYKASAQASLGTKLNSLLSEGQIELAKLPKLTPDAIQSFNDNMPKGAQSIFDLAPDDVKVSLRKSFENSMTQINGSLNTKMISRQRKAEHDNQIGSGNSGTLNIYDTAMSGDISGAADELQSLMENNQRSLDAGLISQKEHDVINSQALSSLHKGQYNNLLSVAQSQGKEDEFLSALAENKPNELNYQQWEEVKGSVIKQNKAASYLRKSEQQALIAAYKIKDVITPDNVITLKDKLTDTQFYKFMYDYKVKSIGRIQKEDSRQNTMKVWSDSKGFSALSNKEKSEGLAATTKSIQKNMVDPESGAPLYSEDQAERAAVKAAGGPIPSYVDGVEAQMLSGNGEQMTMAVEAYEDINRNHPNNLPLSTRAKATMLAFTDRLQKTGESNLAAQEASQIISNKSSEQLEFAAKMTADYGKTNFKTSAMVMKFAKNLNGINLNELQSEYEYAYEAKRRFNENLSLTMSESSAKKLTQEEMASLYGHTNVNGKKQLVKFPIERTVNMPETKSSSAIINSDIAAQLKAQYAETNRLYDEIGENGQRKSPFYFRITNEPDIQAAMEASKNLESLDSLDPDEGKYYSELKKNMKALNDFNDFKQIELEQVYPDGTSYKHVISAKAGLLMTKNDDPSNPTIHGYDLLSTQEGGGTGPIHGSNQETINGFKYHPSQERLGQVFFELNKHPELIGDSIQEKFEEFSKSNDAKEEFLKDATFSMVDPFTAMAVRNEVEARAKATPSKAATNEESAGKTDKFNLALKVKATAPEATKAYSKVIENNTKLLDSYGINNERRMNYFVAQIAHESDGFRATVEKISNDKAEAKYGNKSSIGRKLGNTQPGDGAKYKGRGLIQLTGRGNYKTIGDMIGVDLINNPEKAENPLVALKVAAAFWESRGLNKLADEKKYTEITRLISGGSTGLQQRKTRLARIEGVKNGRR